MVIKLTFFDANKRMNSLTASEWHMLKFKLLSTFLFILTFISILLESSLGIMRY